jgi:hypothetical protein
MSMYGTQSARGPPLEVRKMNRADVWVQFAAAALQFACVEVAAQYADEMVKEFDQRFVLDRLGVWTQRRTKDTTGTGS